jgi:acetyl-CoA carboxylase biotin carboxyl carrier protein
MRVSVRRTPEPAEPILLPQAEAGEPGAAPAPPPPSDGVVRVEAPMVGVFYRAPQPGAAPFVEEGDTVAPGQTLCILEAMKLMNEIKADAAGVVRSIHVGNAEPVEFGQLLFELEQALPPPLDAV